MAKEQDYEELRELLQSWDAAELLPHLQEAAINVDELQMMKRHHLTKLLSSFRLGTCIRFEHHLERWRQGLNVPLQGVHAETHCQGCRCATSQPQSDCAGDSGKSGNLLAELLLQSTSQPELELDTNAKEQGGGEEKQKPGAVTVLGILKGHSLRGQSLLDIMGQQEKPLDGVQRQLLIQLICSHYIDNDLHLTLTHSHQLEREIMQLFPKEQMHHYRTERRGKIYVRFTNMKRKKRHNSSHQ
ncbi:uncharacterized protein LOC111075004 [Drosophila obscura]|uniref:uncharacterized protein LOC111075004 n=1 Tax=Drosophila obscura TaxID=7282 RepID=UPI001BB1FDA3|nr:uncharacterized protein LOC111075004 [Drosophila obscura]